MQNLFESFLSYISVLIKNSGSPTVLSLYLIGKDPKKKIGFDVGSDCSKAQFLDSLHQQADQEETYWCSKSPATKEC